MGIFEAILAIISGFFKSIPIFNRWFSKTPTQKITDRLKENKKKANKRKETGRG